MRMKCTSVFILLLLIVLISCSSSKKTEQSSADTYVQSNFLNDVIVDGKAAEWAAVPLNFSPRSTLQFAVANDKSHLFIYLRIPDQNEQMKILQGGMEVYIDPAGKKEKVATVTYPVKGELGEIERPQAAPGEKPDLRAFRLRLAGQLISMGRSGFKADYNGVQSIRQNTGFKAAIGWDENDVLIYELAIPLEALPAAINPQHLSLGFTLNGIDRPKYANGTTNFSRESGGRVNGRRGGNFDPNGPNRGQRNAQNNAYNQHEKMYVSETFWAYYQVANRNG